jgi:hypothetical protein
MNPNFFHQNLEEFLKIIGQIHKEFHWIILAWVDVDSISEKLKNEKFNPLMEEFDSSNLFQVFLLVFNIFKKKFFGIWTELMKFFKVNSMLKLSLLFQPMGNRSLLPLFDEEEILF